MEERTRRFGGLIAGAGVGAAAASALRRRWSGRTDAGPALSGPGEIGLRYLDRLAAAVRIPTVATEDRGERDTAAFDRFHEFLADAYPLVHARLEREVVNGHALLFTWRGSDPDAPAVLLMAHQDVVPVEPGTESEWEQAPFSGVVDGAFLWGRGALDDKGSLIAILEAVEGLLDDRFTPEVTLMLAFGDDEEIGGAQGAATIAGVLRERGVRLDFVLDEGGAVVEDLLPGATAPLGLVGIGEKGYVNLELTARGEGGHSSAPPPSTAVGMVAEAVLLLEASPMKAHMGVQEGLMTALASVLSFPQSALLRRSSVFSGLLEKRFSEAPVTNALIRTTMAATMIEGGVKPNVLPQLARAIVNVRIMPGDTIEAVVSHARSVVGDTVSVGILEEGFTSDPPLLSDPDGPAFGLVADAIKEFWGVAAAPWILTGATDSRHFGDLAPGAVYRFAPFTATPDDLGRIHGTNERLRISDADRAVAFFDRLIRMACRA